MAFNFLFSYDQLNLAFFTFKEKNAIYQTKLLKEKVIKIFQYLKNNDRYQDGAKLYQQMVHKALSITKTLYLEYSFPYLFDNVINNSIFVKDILQVKDINKEYKRNQAILCN